ncbi:MAG: methyltransferase domain-containing protein [Zoogloeaceae bacterium]|nr:methyltransferase domain-containing protein [Zoogloeaceae bacterium]
MLRAPDGQYNLIVIGALVETDSVRFPSFLQGWTPENIGHLAETILAETRKTVRNREIRALHPSPRLPVSEIVTTTERIVPGLRDYTTVVNHIKRYKFLLDHIRPGKILECACGSGYGAAILARLDGVQNYHGVDLSDIAVFFANGNVWDERFSFHAVDLAEPAPCQYENVISLETIEHVPNPYRFIELLIGKMASGGQLLLSLPAETWGGSHLNPWHFSNWNRKRLLRFLDQYFEEITVFNQKLSLLGPTTFDASEISGGAPDEDRDEVFVCILRKPRRNRRPAIVVKRLKALGDVIWITPILRALRRLHPEHDLIVVSEKTEVFLRNPDVDLVFGPQYEPSRGDRVIDLDWAYERRRQLHLLDAYADVADIPLLSREPALYPSFRDHGVCADVVRKYFGTADVQYLLAVHMQANSPDRVWPQEYWKRLLQRLLDENSALGMIVLGHDKDFNTVDIGLCSNRILDMTSKLDVMRSAVMLSFCDLLLAPDSGVLHIAAAMHTPALGLFSMADPATRLPFSARCRAIWADVECRGCLAGVAAEKVPRCPRGHAECMEKIDVETVFAEAVRMLASGMPNRWRDRCGRSNELNGIESKAFSLSSRVATPIPVFVKKAYVRLIGIGSSYKFRFVVRFVNLLLNLLTKRS